MFRARWLTASVYALAGAAFALVMAVGFLEASGDDLVSSRRVATLFWIYFWPTDSRHQSGGGTPHTVSRGGHRLVLRRAGALGRRHLWPVRHECRGVAVAVVDSGWARNVDAGGVHDAPAACRRSAGVGLSRRRLGRRLCDPCGVPATERQRVARARRSRRTPGTRSRCDFLRRHVARLRCLHDAGVAHPEVAGAPLRALLDIGRVPANRRHRSPLRRRWIDQHGVERSALDPRRLRRLRRLVGVRRVSASGSPTDCVQPDGPTCCCCASSRSVHAANDSSPACSACGCDRATSR